MEHSTAPSDPSPSPAPPLSPPSALSIPPSLAALLDKRWIDDALRNAQDLNQTLAAAAETTIKTTTIAFSQLVAASSQTLADAKEKLEIGKSHYAAAEQEAVWKIKEGVAVAAAHPALSCGVAAGLGLVLLKRPRRALIRNTRRIFLSEETLISNFQTKVKELEQSVNLMKNESVKLQNRATQAEEEIKRAQSNLKKEGILITKELRAANNIESQIKDLRDRINELPKREISGFQSQVSTYASQIKQEKKSLNGALTKIINHGIPL